MNLINSLILVFCSGFALSQNASIDTIILHSNFYNSYSPESYRQPNQLFLDSCKLVRLSQDSSLFSGVIIEEYRHYSHPHSTIDTLFFYFSGGLNTEKKKLIYKGSKKRHWITEQPEFYYLHKNIHEDTTVTYSESGRLTERLVRNDQMRKLDPMTPYRHTYYTYFPDRDRTEILHREYMEEYCHRKEVEIILYGTDTSSIRQSQYSTCHGGESSKYTAYDRFGNVYLVHTTDKSSDNDKGYEAITRFNSLGDTVLHSEQLDGLQTGLSINVLQQLIDNSRISIPIYCYWSQGILVKIDCQEAIYLSEKNKFVDSRKFIEEYKKFCKKNKRITNPPNIYELIKHFHFQGEVIPKSDQYLIIKCGELEDPQEYYYKFLRNN
jgi:hypothetical protein